MGLSYEKQLKIYIDEVETQALLLAIYRSAYSSPNRPVNILRFVLGMSVVVCDPLGYSYRWSL